MPANQKQQRTLTNRKGKTVVTERTDKEAFTELQRLVLDGWDSEFPVSLLQQGLKRGLSEEQFWWVHKLIEPKDEVPCGNITHRMQEALFAGAKVKDLKLTLTTGQGNPVKISMAGPKSKNHGDVWVTDDGEYPDNKLYGRISRTTGVFVGEGVPQDVQELLATIHDNPDAHLPW